MKISRVGVDLAKNVFQVHGVDPHGKAVWKLKLSREKWLEAIALTVPKGSEIGKETGSERMTTADWFEWGSQAMANTAQFFAIFLTLTSAYLVAAFVAGTNLAKSQLALISTFYILCTSYNISVQTATLNNALYAFNRAASSLEDMDGISSYLVIFFPASWAIILTAITLGCLKFMWDIRHPKT